MLNKLRERVERALALRVAIVDYFSMLIQFVPRGKVHFIKTIRADMVSRRIEDMLPSC